MDPSRIRLEDDRFGLIGAAFRPGNRAVYAGRSGDDHIWSIGIIVGPEDDIQTVEIDDHGAKSSRMLSSGERFEGLDILAAPGTEAYIIAGTFTLMGMELSAAGQGKTHDFAEVLRAAADDHSWRLPLRVVGHPRDLQLSAQGRDILRETAATLERDGTATTSLAAARRLELSEQALDSIRRRISRTSLQAYRMHGRWYVVLDNLARSRTTPAAVEEAPDETGAPIAAEAVVEPVSVDVETRPEMSGAPTEDDLSAFAEPEVAEPEAAAAEAFEPEPAEPGVEYVEEEADAAEPVAAAETGTVETDESEREAAASEAGETVEPEIEAAADVAPSELTTDETVEQVAEPEEAAAVEPDLAEEYRAAATTASPTSRLETDVTEPGDEVIEQATDASVEDLAAAAAAEAEATDETEAMAPSVGETEQPESEETEAPLEPSGETEAEIEVELPVEAEPQIEAEPESADAPLESVEAETDVSEATEPVESEPEALEAEDAAGIEEPVVAEDLSAIEETMAEEPAPAVEESFETETPAAGVETAAEAPEPLVDRAALETTVDEQAATVEEVPAAEAEAAEPEMAAAEPEILTEEPSEDQWTIEAESPAEPVDEAISEHAPDVDSASEEVVEESFASVAEPEAAAERAVEEPAAPAEPEITEQVQSEEALLFADMVKQAAEDERVATELESDVAEESDQLIAERVSEAPAPANGEVVPDVSDAADESETAVEEIEAAGEPSDEVIAEGIRTHAPAYADEVGRDELIETVPASEEQTEPLPAGETETVEADEALPYSEAGEADDVLSQTEVGETEAEAPEAEPAQSGGPSAASYFADARGGTGAHEAAAPPAPADLATHLRGEVAFLRQQSREKDRQIGVWGEGAKWLQPFVDQIRSLEKQVERLGELQVQRENERISDLINERDALRQRLEALEARISSAQIASAPTEPNRRSWFRRMMGSE